MFAAASQNRADVVAFLLDLGVPVSVEDASRQQALHVAASNDAFDVVWLLMERGADLEATEANWNNTPLDHATYSNQAAMVALLASFSRDISRLAWTGNVKRVRELLGSDPTLATVIESDGSTPLMWLPDDEELAVEVVSLVLGNGADASARNAYGERAGDIASKRGLDEAAALLRRAERA